MSIKKCKECPHVVFKPSIVDGSYIKSCKILSQTLLNHNVRNKVPGNCPLYNWTYKLVYTH